VNADAVAAIAAAADANNAARAVFFMGTPSFF
jgi:hypothetical protein